ncbi:acyltransferase family protein [Marinagarivorans algicola]|uniref:acyltransferase family protein n=1 Tax=Marinagarivorans algicola TaxID=1513270 RepID=UPI0006B5AE4A|nr:acyltransferase family protein [Marinagarivorans algicola]
MQFRKDINGLRAIAVIAVVLFHFSAVWMPGGFAGVDVFFVISGFLMTGIIFKAIEQEQFSIAKFYIARANRIIPALAALCVILLLFGWLYLIPSDYNTLGKHIAGSLTFVSNMVYFKEAGYFDAASNQKWLLHTWSLSVEWQFYIVYPLILMAMSKFMTLNSMKMTVLIGTVLGFILCVVVSYQWPNAAYYLLPARAWEMLIGGVAYLYPMAIKEDYKKRLEWLGFALIVGAYFFISKNNPWPGYLALLPIAGTFLIIQVQRNDSLLTGNVVFQKLGTWSYSIYLWHWPVVVAIYYFSLSESFIYLGLGLCVLLGFISYQYIEKYRFNNHFSGLLSYLKCQPLYMVLVIGAISLAVYHFTLNGYRYQIPKSVLSSFKRGDYECFNKDNLHAKVDNFCTITEGQKKVFAFGDSHSYSSLPALELFAKGNNFALTYASYSACPPLIGVFPKHANTIDKNCQLLNDKVINFVIDNRYDFVFLAARWTYYTQGDYTDGAMQYIVTKKDEPASQLNSIAAFKKGLAETFKRYSDSKIKVIVMLQVPQQEIDSKKIYYNALVSNQVQQVLLNKKAISLQKHMAFQQATNKMIRDEAKRYDNITVVDPTSSLCDSNICAVGDEAGSYYFDDDHLSVYGNHQLKDFITSSIQ